MPPSPNIIRIATCVAHRIAAGEEWESTVRDTARSLEISEGAVWHCVKTMADYLGDPYLESIG